MRSRARPAATTPKIANRSSTSDFSFHERENARQGAPAQEEVDRGHLGELAAVRSWRAADQPNHAPAGTGRYPSRGGKETNPLPQSSFTAPRVERGPSQFGRAPLDRSLDGALR